MQLGNGKLTQDQPKEDRVGLDDLSNHNVRCLSIGDKSLNAADLGKKWEGGSHNDREDGRKRKSGHRKRGIN